MGILDDYKKRESERINKLYDRADCLTDGQTNELIRYIFMGFFDSGFAGQTAAKSLILKINKVLNIKYVPAKGEFDKWHEEFCSVEFGVKKALLVTVANDLCRMNIFTETQILEKVDHFLKDIPGILAGTRDIE